MLHALAVFSLLLATPATAPAQEAYPDGARPHSSLSIRDRDAIAVTELDAATRRSGRSLVVRVTVSAHTRDGRTRRAVVRVGRCVPGSPQFPACPPTLSRRMTLSGRSSTVRLTARVPVPRPSADAIRVSVTRPGEVPRPRHPGAHALLEVQGEGWRAPLAGETFGAVTRMPQGAEVVDLRMDAVGIGDGAVRPTIRWSATTPQPLSVRWSYAESDERPVSLVPGGRNNGVFTRPFIRTESPRVGMTGAVDGAELFAVKLPTPRR